MTIDQMLDKTLGRLIERLLWKTPRFRDQLKEIEDEEENYTLSKLKHPYLTLEQNYDLLASDFDALEESHKTWRLSLDNR